MKPLWEIEWISSLPELPGGESDFDCATYSARRFPSEGLARAFGKKVAGESPLGVAQMRRIEEVAWQDCDDGELAYWFESGKRLAYIGRVEEIDSAPDADRRATPEGR